MVSPLCCGRPVRLTPPSISPPGRKSSATCAKKRRKLQPTEIVALFGGFFADLRAPGPPGPQRGAGGPAQVSASRAARGSRIAGLPRLGELVGHLIGQALAHRSPRALGDG